MNETRTVAVFDFDGTLTTKDTFVQFIRHCFGQWKTLCGFLLYSPFLVLYKLRLIRNDVVKQMVFSFFFKGMRKSLFESKCKEFVNRIDEITNREAMNKLNFHIKNGHTAIIISASIDNWIHPWAELNGISQVLGTKIEIEGDVLTGRFSSPNCFGDQKVVRLKEYFPNWSDTVFYAYGDSSGDKELLEFADYSYFRRFN